jgi:hypothetical protein
MSPLIRKEIRLLFPFWALAMLLAVVPSFLAPRIGYLVGLEPIIFQAVGFGLIFMGLAPFGQEFSMGMFSPLLAQPIDRRRIWRLKIRLITIAGLLVLIAFALSIHARLDANPKEVMQRFGLAGHLVPAQIAALNWRAEQFWPACGRALLLVAVGVSGGLWATLLFRQMGAALWFVILIPAGLYVLVEGIFHNLPGNAPEIIAATALSVYSVAGFVWARRMFATAQDSQWLGETISLLSLTPAKARADSAVSGRRGAVRALVRKEFQSHQISLLIGFGLLVLHVCTLIFRKFYTLPHASELRFAVEAVPFLWLLVPWLLGSVAVAEERKLGTMESQLCLPVTRRVQFTIKLCVALLLGTLLGGPMPCLIEGLGSWAGVSSEIVTSTSSPGGSFYFATVGETALAAGAIVIISFFGSTLTRNTLHALGGTILMGVAFVALFQWVAFETTEYDYSLWKGPLIFVTGIPVSIITIICLSFFNYKRLYVGHRLWLRNLLILFGVWFFTGIATAFFYERPWELVMSLEPQHGPARLSGDVRPKICMPGGRIFALLPDGRLWTGTDYHLKELDRYGEVWDSKSFTNRLEKARVQLPASGLFLGGSNWVSLAANDRSSEVVALQSDGTLWSILSREDRTNSRSRTAWLSVPPEPHRIGSDANWQSVAAGERFFLAVKTDGTLWGWGNNEQGRFAPDAHDRISEPMRIGTDSDWAAIFLDNEFWLMKRDGSIWEWSKAEREERFEMRKSILNGADWLEVAGTPGGFLVLRRDDTLWGGGHLPKVLFGSHDRLDEIDRSLRPIGNLPEWAQIFASRNSFVGIRKDGALVESETQLFSGALGQPSRYSDWLAGNLDWDGLVTLAADGTVSNWQDTRHGKEVLLAPTHRPLWSLNIFTGSQK